MKVDNFSKNCAQGENRTLMMLPSIDFESIASTNSATWASVMAIHTFYTKNTFKSI